MNRRYRRRRMYRTLAVAGALLVLTTVLFAWSAKQCVDAFGRQYEQQLIVAGSVWLVDLAFSVVVAWDSGRYLMRRIEYSLDPLPRRPEPADRTVMQSQVSPEQTLIDRRVVDEAAGRVVYSSTGKHAIPGYIPMSQRPDATLLDIPPVTRVQPRTDWRPQVSETATSADPSVMAW